MDELIYNTAIADGMPPILATYLVAQARHETGNYKSRFFTVGKNAFGYSYVQGAKWQLPAPGPKADNGASVAQYASVANSVHEITDWIARRQREGRFPADLATITSPEEYSRLLKNAGYYGASYDTYTAALIRHLAEIGQMAVSPVGLVTVAAIAALLVTYRKQLFR